MGAVGRRYGRACRPAGRPVSALMLPAVFVLTDYDVVGAAGGGAMQACGQCRSTAGDVRFQRLGRPLVWRCADRLIAVK